MNNERQGQGRRGPGTEGGERIELKVTFDTEVWVEMVHGKWQKVVKIGRRTLDVVL